MVKYCQTARKLKRGEIPSKQLLFNMYITKDMTAKEIGDILGKSKRTIASYVKKYGMSKKECKSKIDTLNEVLNTLNKDNEKFFNQCKDSNFFCRVITKIKYFI